MSDNDNNRSTGGVGFFGLLFIALLVLKLIGIINISWWWITAPLWAPTTICIVLIIILCIIRMCIRLRAYHTEDKIRKSNAK